jgi:UDP-N-acetylmuramyl pentapeptide phosphotransferase/UDP-N-acetylglucosamine-1-phosphate transferase
MPNRIVAGSVVAALVAAAAIGILRRYAHALPADIPNARSLHAQPVPRAGGLAIWAGFLPIALILPPPFPGGLGGWMPAWAALFAVSALDDRRGTGVGVRLGVHALAAVWTALWLAAAAVHSTSAAFHPEAGATYVLAVTGFALVLGWSANLFNFMDGNDGLAAAMGIIGFAAYGLAALHGAPGGFAGAAADAASESRRSQQAAPAFFALAAAIVPFLAVNRPRASMFLGDAGAVPLGYLAAAFGIGGIVAGFWPAWFPLLVFLPFVADATATLLRRVLGGERIREAHREHYYQRLHRLGAGHGGTLAAYAVTMTVTAATALLCLEVAPAAGSWALALCCVVVIMLFAAIDYHWRKNTRIPTPR